MKATKELLHQVELDNIRDHQIGEVEGGISWDVAKDLGFITTDQVTELIQAHGIDAQSAPTSRLTVAKKNANERAHIAKAREDRRKSGF